jgi:CarD family transcriptional regulator
MVRELAAVEDVTETEAAKQIEANLLKGPRRTPKGAEPETQEEAA